MSDKVFFGNVKKITTKFGELVKIGFNRTDIEKLSNNIKGDWVNLVIKQSRNDETKFYITLDDYKPKQRESGNVQSSPDDEDIQIPGEEEMF